MGIGGLWVHRIDRCEGGPAGIIAACIATGADRLIVKCRDGRSAYNEKEIGILASMAMAEGIPFFPWAWPYSTEKHGDPGYIDAQATRIAEDARRLGAAGVILNIEAPFSWGYGHRWADRHADQYGSKQARRAALRERTRELLTTTRSGIDSAILSVSTFPTPSAHALAFDIMAKLSDEILPQCYFKGPGWASKTAKAIGQWKKLEAKVIRFTGPGWRGPTKMRSMAAAVRLVQGLDAPIDWWVLDKMDPRELDAAAALMGGQCPVTS